MGQQGNVKDIRLALGMTQTDLARRLKVAVSTVQRWEQDQSRPSPLAAEKILRLERQARRSAART